jgi:hypothetical protein
MITFPGIPEIINLLSKPLVLFDLETKKAVPPGDGVLMPDIQYCKGWKDFPNMGISIASWCKLGEPPNVMIVKDPGDLRVLMEGWRDQGYLVGGFGNFKFDDRLLSANGFPFKSDFDLLVEIIKAAGLSGVKYWNQVPKRSYSLDSIAKKNGMAKTEHGALAPVLWQTGQIDRLCSYGKTDAWIESVMTEKFLDGSLIDPNTDCLLKYQP